MLRRGDNGGEAEVGDFDLAGFCEEDVFGFDVAVDDAAVMGVLEGVADLGDDGEGGVGVEWGGVEELAEGETVDEFHEEEEESFEFRVSSFELCVLRGHRRGVFSRRRADGRGALAEVIDGDDVGVVEFGEGLGFVGEALGEGRIGGELRGEDFEGDDAVEGFLAGFVDGALSAAAAEGEEVEVGEIGGELIVGGRGPGGGFLFGDFGAGDGVGFEAAFEEAGAAEGVGAREG